MELIFNVIAIIEAGVVSYGANLPKKGLTPGPRRYNSFRLTAHLWQIGYIKYVAVDY